MASTRWRRELRLIESEAPSLCLLATATDCRLRQLGVSMAAEVGIGRATCAAWAQRRRGGDGPARLLVVYGRAATASSPPRLDLHAFDAGASAVAADPLVSFVMGQEEDDAPRAIAVHPSGEEFVCATAKGCRLFKLVTEEFNVRLISKDAPPLQSVGPQKCLSFSTDGAKFAVGGEDGHLRIFHWPDLNLLLDEPKAHKSFRDMDIRMRRLSVAAFLGMEINLSCSAHL